VRVIPDTNVWIPWLAAPPPSFDLGAHGRGRVLVCTIALQELWAGARSEAERADCERLFQTARQGKRLVNPPTVAWVLAGQALALLARRGRLGAARLRAFRNDVLLAATAWAYDAAVMTHNRADFMTIAEVLPVRVVGPS
jgi:predicted nucleic acid-binding protein